MQNKTSIILSCLVLHDFCLIEVEERIEKERGTVCSHGDAGDFLKDEPSEPDKYVIQNKLRHTDDFIFCEEPYVFCLVFDKMN